MSTFQKMEKLKPRSLWRQSMKMFTPEKKKDNGTIIISAPKGFKLKNHVEVDERSSTGLTGLPDSWVKLLKKSKITKERVLANHKQVLAALKFIENGPRNDKIPLLTAEELKKQMDNTAKIVQVNPETRYEKLERIGEGAGGIVHKIRLKKTGEVKAVKISPKEELKYIQSEIAFHAMSTHENIVNYTETFLWKSDVWIVMDFVDGGSLTDILGEDNPSEWSEPHIAFVMREILKGLEYMHNKHLLHRDIKSDNVLVGRDGTVKLADFGFAIGLTKEQEKRKSTVGTPFWMAPEVIQGLEYDSRCDIWSLGVTAIELVNHEPPHMNKPQLEALLDILTDPPPMPHNPDICSPDFLEFLGCCLQKDPQERSFSTQLLGHKFLTKACPKEKFAEWVNYVLDYKIENGLLN